jgi:hypothetical protein
MLVAALSGMFLWESGRQKKCRVAPRGTDVVVCAPFQTPTIIPPCIRRALQPIDVQVQGKLLRASVRNRLERPGVHFGWRITRKHPRR